MANRDIDHDFLAAHGDMLPKWVRHSSKQHAV